MVPSISLARIQTLHPVLRTRSLNFLGAMDQLGIPVVVSEALRSWEVQAAYFAKGRTVKSDIACRHGGVTRPVGTCDMHPLGATVTNARPGDSMHQYGLAFDAEPDDVGQNGIQPDWNIDHPAWRVMLATAKSFNLAEGAEWRTFPDSPHFYPQELPANPPTELKVAYQRGALPAAWKWADQYLKA